MKQAILFSRNISTQDSLYWHSCPKYSTKALIGSRMCPYNLRQTIFRSKPNNFSICWERFSGMPTPVLRALLCQTPCPTSHKRFFVRKGSHPSDTLCTNALRWTFCLYILHRDFTGKWYTAYRFRFTNVNKLVINRVMVKGLTRAFSCRIFAGRKQTLNTATMDFKRIAHHAVRRWNKKRKAEKAANTPRTAAPQEETLPKAANLKSALGSFLAGLHCVMEIWKKHPQHLAMPMKSRNFAPLFSIIERCTHRVMVRLSINHLI